MTPPVAPGATGASLQQRFDTFADLVRNRGVFAGTAHTRINIPKTKLTEQEIGQLGFEPVVLAIPEAGQDRFQTWRHPDHNFHIHSHGDRWTMHEDRHAAATMLRRRLGTPKAFVQGMPHVLTEGVPGMYYYLKGQAFGRKSTADNVDQELPLDVRSQIENMPDAPATPKTALDVHQATRLKTRRRGFYEDPSPGFHDVKAKFEEAARKGLGRETKLAEHEVAALYDVLAKFGFLGDDRQDKDPVAAISAILRNADFGFGLPSRDKASKPFGPSKRDGVSPWSNPAPIDSGNAASRMGQDASGGLSYGGV